MIDEETWLNKTRRVSRRFLMKLTIFPRKLIRFVEKIIAYSPLLWRDCDWDYMFILDMLSFKLRRTRERIVKNNLVQDAEKIGQQIKIAELLIKRIREDDYHSCLRESHEEKYGKIDLSFEPYDDKYKTVNFSHTKCNTEEEEKEASQTSIAISDKEQASRKADLDYLFKHLRNHLLGWWD